jgi:methionyl-tRNA formyltransferase
VKRVVFMGTPEFAVPTLDALHAAGHELVLVVAQPDAPSGRGQQLQPPPVARRARELGLPLAQPRAIHTGSFAERYRALEADVAVVIAYGRILGELHLRSPRFGAVNLHASLLPRWRGAAPIQAALLAGDAETGVCAQRMEQGLDTGDVYVERRVPIGPRETADSLHDRLAALSAEVALQTLDALPGLVPIPQPEDGVCWAPKISKADGLLDLTLPAVALDRRIRAMTSWPGGYVPGASGPLKVLEALPVAGAGPAGAVLSLRPLIVACGQGALELIRVQAPGRKPVSGAELANGLRLSVGGALWS